MMIGCNAIRKGNWGDISLGKRGNDSTLGESVILELLITDITLIITKINTRHDNCNYH